MIYSLNKLKERKKKFIDKNLAETDTAIDCDLIRKQLMMCINQKKNCLKWQETFKQNCIFKNIIL